MGSPKAGRTPASPSRPTNPTGTAGRVTATTRQNAERRPPTDQGTATRLPADADNDAIGAPASKRILRSQGRRTMRKLLDAAMDAFDSRGYHATRVNDVVEIAKTSHGTFYLYFANKEDVLRALVNEAATEVQSLHDALSALPAEGHSLRWEDVHGWVQAYSELWDSIRAAVPGLDRPGNDRSRPPGCDPWHLYGAIGCAYATDRSGLVRPHHRSRGGGLGYARHARSVPLSPRIHSTTDR